jgi:hypothetical protein
MKTRRKTLRRYRRLKLKGGGEKWRSRSGDEGSRKAMLCLLCYFRIFICQAHVFGTALLRRAWRPCVSVAGSGSTAVTDCSIRRWNSSAARIKHVTPYVSLKHTASAPLTAATLVKRLIFLDSFLEYRKNSQRLAFMEVRFMVWSSTIETSSGKTFGRFFFNSCTSANPLNHTGNYMYHLL